jgi:hypothetical protein
MGDFDYPCEDDGWGGLEWQGWMIIGPLAEKALPVRSGNGSGSGEKIGVRTIPGL